MKPLWFHVSFGPGAISEEACEEKAHRFFGTSNLSQCSHSKTLYIAERQLLSLHTWRKFTEEIFNLAREQVISSEIGSFVLLGSLNREHIILDHPLLISIDAEM